MNSWNLLSVVHIAMVVSAVWGAHIHTDYNTNGITCYTCPRMANNTQCNQWAPDIPCPVELAVCKTVHVFDAASRKSVSVTKMCALPEHCSPDHVGCQLSNNTIHIECVSCCSQSYCNKPVPYSTSTSKQLSVTLIGNSNSHVITGTYLVFICAIISKLWCVQL